MVVRRSREDKVKADFLVRVDMRRACFGFIVRDGVIIECAPYGEAILRRARITSGREAVKLFRAKGAIVTWQRF